MKLPYFEITEAFKEAKDSFSYGSGSDKITSSAKLLGKSFANVGMLVVEAGVEIVKRAPEIAGKVSQENLDKRSHLMTEEQIENAHRMVDRGKESEKRRLEEERKRRKESD